MSETDEWLEATVEGGEGGGHGEFEDAWELADDEATAMDETTGSEESHSEGGSIHKVEEVVVDMMMTIQGRAVLLQASGAKGGALRGVVVGNDR